MNQIGAVQFSVIVNVNRLRCKLMLTVPDFFFQEEDKRGILLQGKRVWQVFSLIPSLTSLIK